MSRGTNLRSKKFRKVIMAEHEEKRGKVTHDREPETTYDKLYRKVGKLRED